MVSPARRTSPSVALTKELAAWRTCTSPERTVTVVAAASARPPKPPPRPNAVITRTAMAPYPSAFRRRFGSEKPPIHTTPAELPILTTASEPMDAPSPAHLPFGGLASSATQPVVLAARDRVLVARRRVLRKSDEEWPRAAGLDRQRFGEPALREDRDAQAVQTFGAPLPLGAAHRARERPIRHPLSVRQQDLR